jgi:hypothetical protein
MTTEVSTWLTALVLFVATISKCEICLVLRNIDLIWSPPNIKKWDAIVRGFEYFVGLSEKG